MRELNLLPQQYKFDIQKYFLLKKIILISSINFIVIAIITGFLFYLIKKETKFVKYSTRVLNKMQEINKKFDPYFKEYNEIQKKINELDNKKRIYFINYKVKYSPFLSTLIFLKTITNGIRITSINYSNGGFDISGLAQSNQAFYSYYKNLKQDKNIKKVQFFYLKKDKEKGYLSFKLKIKTKEIY